MNRDKANQNYLSILILSGIYRCLFNFSGIFSSEYLICILTQFDGKENHKRRQAEKRKVLLFNFAEAESFPTNCRVCLCRAVQDNNRCRRRRMLFYEMPVQFHRKEIKSAFYRNI
jgi:hypothetical protein